MDWFKVKTKHVFHDGFDSKTGWAWIKIMALTSELEGSPTDVQILRTITKKEHELLQKHFENLSTSIQNVIEKVLEDAEKLKKERGRLKEYRAKISEKDDNRTSTEPRREHDKSRVDKNRVDKSRDIVGNPPPQTVQKRPTIDQIKQYCIERNNAVDPDKFFNFYESNGWKVGKNPMKNWKACVITWEKTEYNKPRKESNMELVNRINQSIINQSEVIDVKSI